jgi:hypothetical protein
MTSEDVWVETVHESERRDGKKNNSVAVGDDTMRAENPKKRSGANKAKPAKGTRGQDRKRVA